MSGGLGAVPGWSPAMRQALAQALAQFPPPSRRRGERYVAEDRVVQVDVFPEHVDGTVEGGELYEVTWEYRRGSWHASCSCPVGHTCKHAYVVARVLLEEPPGDLRTAAEPKAQPKLLDALRTAVGAWERQHVLGRLLAGTRGAALARYGSPLHEFLDEADAELFCWRAAHTIIRHAGGWLPATLEPYRERPDLAARFEARRRDELVRELVGWAGRLGATSERSLRVVFLLARTAQDDAVVRVEARLTSPKMRDVPRSSTQLQQLRNQVLYDPSFLPPEQAALLVWLTDTGSVAPSPTSPTIRAGRPACLPCSSVSAARRSLPGAMRRTPRWRPEPA